MIKYMIKNTIIKYKRSFKMKLEFDKLKLINHSLFIDYLMWLILTGVFSTVNR